MKNTVLAILAVGLLAGPMAANATMWTFSYSGTGVSANGTLMTGNNLGNGSYLITGINGDRNGQAISGLAAPNTISGYVWDNLLFPAGPQFVDTGGFVFQTADGYFNVCSNQAPAIASCGNGGSQEFNMQTGGMVGIDMTVSQVPEPGTLALLGLGLGLICISLGLSRRRRAN
ncbi:MAG: PEP-CTERM sorting domain-containing protein [Steroidobacteraceae bacterium]